MEKNYFKPALAGLTATVLLVLACSGCQPTADRPFIAPPFPHLDVPFQVFQADTERDNLFDLPNGGHLKVPAKAFVDANGNVLSGTVELRYREMHNDVDIFRTGIPMEYDSGGRRQLETAGMFELRGSQNGSEVQVRQGAALEVRLASFSPDNNFMAYYLDEKDRNWKFLDYDRAEVNREKAEKSKALEIKALRSNAKGYFVLNYSEVLDLEYKFNMYSKQLNHDAMNAKIQAYGLQCINAVGRAAVKWGSRDLDVEMMVWKRLDNKPLPGWISPTNIPSGRVLGTYDHFQQLRELSPNYTEAVSLGGKKYTLVFFRPNPKDWQHPLDSFKTEAEIVMSLQELFRYPAKYWQAHEKEALAKIEAERDRLEKMADAFRTLEVSGFGIYNYDRLLQQENVVAQVGFRFDSQWADQSLAVQEVWLIPSGNRSVVKWTRDNWASVPLPVDGKAKLLAVLPDSRLAVFTAEKFAAIDIGALRKEERPRYTFDMHVLPDQMASPEDLVKAIQGG
jgi:hypothetical protein